MGREYARSVENRSRFIGTEKSMTLRSQPPPSKIQQIFEVRLQTLISWPRFYRTAAHRFLVFLKADFPQVLRLSHFTRVHARLYRPGVAQILPHAPPNPSPLQRAFEKLDNEIELQVRHAKLAARNLSHLHQLLKVKTPSAMNRLDAGFYCLNLRPWSATTRSS